MKLDFPCTYYELVKWCKKNDFTETLTHSRLLTSDNPKAPLDIVDKKEQEEQILENGPPTMALRDFVDCCLVEAIDDFDTIPTFCELMKTNGLVVRDKVIEGEPVDSDSLLEALMMREEQADNAFGDDNFQFWDTLSKEFYYSVHQDDVEKAYSNAGKSQFPWLNWLGEFVKLNVPEPETSAKSKQACMPDFDKRQIILPKKYTHKLVHIELNKLSQDEKLFDIELSTFKKHFWQKQKIAKLTRGNKSNIL